VPKGALFSVDGVAMQGSGKVTIEVIDPVTGEAVMEVLHFELNNPQDLHWLNEDGRPSNWEDGAFTNGHPYQIENPEDAEFRPVSKAEGFTSGISIAGPPELRGQEIYVPELAGYAGNEDGLFRVEDAGGAFPSGSRRFDVFFDDVEMGRGWYNDTYDIRRDGGSPAYVQQRIPPELELTSNP
jgi:hypothetical protein